MKASESDKESAELAQSDMIVMDDLTHWLSAYHFEVNACGNRGELEMAKCRELARQAIKRLVNYI